MSFMFNEKYRRNKRRELVNDLYDKLEGTGVPHNILAFVLKAIHFTMCYFTLLIYLFAPLGISIITLIISIGVWCMFIYTSGCFLSNLEYKLDSRDFINIIDPYLSIANYPINDKTRHTWTWYLVMLYFTISIAIIYIRLKIRNFIKS